MQRLEVDVCRGRPLLAQPFQLAGAHFPTARGNLQPTVRGGQPLVHTGKIDRYTPTTDVTGPGVQLRNWVVEVEGVRCGKWQIVAQREAPTGVCVKRCLNALPHRLTGGLEGERLSIEGHGDVTGEGAPDGDCACGLHDEQSR